ncbi:MAG: hypothetical protein E6J68_08315 [Deltaproteobacteria bacterium]|nr:MAG: hypothetical protein E6J68_08315 [Deltaproteobacteria bacterium]TMB43965.1 MAG: hypothetical protein E6J55_11310 [Deltaproteobacteria bacterium]
MKRLSLVLGVLALGLGAIARPLPAAAQQVVVLGGPTLAVTSQPCSAFTLYAPYGGYDPWAPPAATLFTAPRACGIGHYPPGFWGTDLVWRYSGPHVHAYTLR